MNSLSVHSFKKYQIEGGYIRKVFWGGVAACCFMLIAILVIPASHAADTVKFGSIDVQKVLNESESGKKAKTDLEVLIKSKQSTIDEKGNTNALNEMLNQVQHHKKKCVIPNLFR